MTKAKRAEVKRTRPRKGGANPAAGAAPAPEAAPASGGRPGVPAPTRPAGQRLWDMPYSAAAPRMINPSIGLHNLVARAGHNAGYDIDLTLLDAPDHRLIRSGVLLAHRVLDGRGEWYLGAPDWVPLLPKERIDPMSQGDLPEELADLVRPFRRRAPLGPVAALRCERREFALRDDHGTTLALLRDDKVTVRRGGLTTARYREVMLTPVGPGLTEEQDFWLCQVLGLAGATRVEKFPRLVNRLGAPSNGPTDFPVPAAPGEAPTFGAFATALLGRRLRELVEADLAVRADRPDGLAALREAAARLEAEVRTLAPVLDPDWVDDLAEELAWVVGLTEAGGAEPGREVVKPRLRSERYLTLLERLVTAARGARAGAYSGRPTGEVLQLRLERSGRALAKAAERVSRDGSTEACDAAAEALEDLLRLRGVLELAGTDRTGAALISLHRLQDALAETRRRAAAADQTRIDAVSAAPLQAFELGRRYERERLEAKAARDAFSRQWAKTERKLSRVLARD